VVEDGSRRVFGTGEPHAEIAIHDRRFWLDVARGGSTGLGESYVAGRWSSPDLVLLIRLFLRNRSALERLETPASRLLRRLGAAVGNARTASSSGRRKNVAAHYDLGNDFFEQVLDPTLSYSCAVFPHAGATLEQASREKLRRVLDELAVAPGQRLLEIGTGWGALALAAADRGLEVTTTTLSRAQAEHTRARALQAGRSDRVRVVELDWTELDGRFDALVSIEMLEAVGPSRYADFFRVCRDRLLPGGRMLIQTIVTPDALFERERGRVGFIKKHVFPGSCLPSVAALRAAVAQVPGLVWRDLHDIGAHYAPTLAAWRENLLGRAPAIRALGYPQELIRTWDYYLAYCEGGFREGVIGDVQLLLERER
jgi:cyclopropane-fatty-acyl-phospholipid synthase